MRRMALQESRQPMASDAHVGISRQESKIIHKGTFATCRCLLRDATGS
jgi:hypothetical protein